jgi:hypothetical protein
MASLDELQLQWVLWLGQGDIQRGIRRAVNMVESIYFNHPTPQYLTEAEVGSRYDIDLDYIGYYEVNPPAPDDRD